MVEFGIETFVRLWNRCQVRPGGAWIGSTYLPTRIPVLWKVFWYGRRSPVGHTPLYQRGRCLIRLVE